MSQLNQALKVALAAAESLPPHLQRQLAERLLASITSEEKTVTVELKQLPLAKQKRLAELMDKNNEGLITEAEYDELRGLGAEVDQMMLANSETLARAVRPELFDEQGKPIKRLFNAALKAPATKRQTRKSSAARNPNTRKSKRM